MKLKKILPLLEPNYETFLMLENDETETVVPFTNNYELYKNYYVIKLQPYFSKGRNGILFIISNE